MLTALLEDLFAMGNKQEAVARQPLSKPRVVHGCHDGLACACCSDEEVAVLASSASNLDLLQQALLERLQPDFDGREQRV